MAKGGAGRHGGLASADYERLAAFRYALRRFLSFSESAAGRAGLTEQQYQAMLAIRSLDRRGPISINDLARQLLIRHNSAVELVDRLVAHGILVRERMPEDRRKARLRLSARGERVLGRLASVHGQRLRRIGPDIRRRLGELTENWRRGG